MTTTLVTGGAGYIGSHMVRVLQAAKRRVAVVDDLSTGHAQTLPADVPFLHANISDRAALTAFMRAQEVSAVMHFASRIQVGESVVDPRLYYVGNLAASITLLESALDAGVKRVVLSSTAAVYGNPLSNPIPEDHRCEPINPYGETKLAIEKMLASYCRAYGVSFAALRYFNAAGADWEQRLGEAHEPESHLIPIVLDAAMGRRAAIGIYGDDYATPDGTCVRDYIHVLDLCDAHLATLQYLEGGGVSTAFNLGTGRGHSVRQVIQTAERITRLSIPCTICPRRTGDPAFLVASPERAMDQLGWQATRSTLERILSDAWHWHQIAFPKQAPPFTPTSQPWERPS